MSYFNAVIEDKAAFERALDTPLPVFTLFASETCGACKAALPRFAEMAKAHDGKIKVLILDCANTPRHPKVVRIPTLLIYEKGELVETLEGVSEPSLLQAFLQYA